MAATNKRTWITVVVGVFILLAICGIAVIGGVAYIVSSHFQTEAVAAEPASHRFAEARQRFAGQQPLIEIRGPHDSVVREHISTTPPGAARKLNAMRALVYDPGVGRLIDLRIPFWLLRMTPDSTDWSFISDSGVDIDSRDIKLNAADLERFGPVLVLDVTDAKGHQVLVWTE